MSSPLDRLQDFGTRSLLLHAIMAVAFAGAIYFGILGEEPLEQVAFVGLLAFSAGLWVAHSVHSLGNALAGEDYGGILQVLSRYVE